MRKAFADTLFRMAGEDPRLIFITGDLGFQVFDRFQADYPKRFINVGVAEAQMINLAAGLAMEGWHPIVYSIASFATARPFEQIRFCVAYHHLPVTIVGAGRAFTYSTSGVSHHATDDIALMSCIPGMTVVIPGDAREVNDLLPQVLRLEGPAYFTIGRYGEPSYQANSSAELGLARLLHPGEKIAIISTGEIAYEVMQALHLIEGEGISPIFYQMHTVKPLDTHTLDELSAKVKTMLVIEEHVPTGGLWSAVANWKASVNSPIRLLRMGPADEFMLGNLKREELRRREGYDAIGIADAIRNLWNNQL